MSEAWREFANSTKQTRIDDKAETDAPVDTTLETVAVLLRLAIENVRLAEITASRASYWHTSEDCHNIGIALEKTLASFPAGVLP